MCTICAANCGVGSIFIQLSSCCRVITTAGFAFISNLVRCRTDCIGVVVGDAFCTVKLLIRNIHQNIYGFFFRFFGSAGLCIFQCIGNGVANSFTAAGSTGNRFDICSIRRRLFGNDLGNNGFVFSSFFGPSVFCPTKILFVVFVISISHRDADLADLTVCHSNCGINGIIEVLFVHKIRALSRSGISIVFIAGGRDRQDQKTEDHRQSEQCGQ